MIGDSEYRFIYSELLNHCQNQSSIYEYVFCVLLPRQSNKTLYIFCQIGKHFALRNYIKLKRSIICTIPCSDNLMEWAVNFTVFINVMQCIMYLAMRYEMENCFQFYTNCNKNKQNKRKVGIWSITVYRILFVFLCKHDCVVGNSLLYNHFSF